MTKGGRRSWFGGEPTLCKNSVLQTASLIQSISQKNTIPCASNMTTNGYLLDVETFQRFYHVGITDYQITLDGWNHDQTRPHASGKGTLEQILNNLVAISALPSESYHFSIVLRHNILPHDEDYSWYDHLQKLFGTDNRFSVLVRPVGNWGNMFDDSLSLLTGPERNALVIKHIEYLKTIGMQCKNGVKRAFSRMCTASFPHSMVFRADGRIEKCTVSLNHPKNLLGYVDAVSGIQIDQNINKLWSTSDLKSECYTCSDVLTCLNMQCRKPCVIDGQEKVPCSPDLLKIY